MARRTTAMAVSAAAGLLTVIAAASSACLSYAERGAGANQETVGAAIRAEFTSHSVESTVPEPVPPSTTTTTTTTSSSTTTTTTILPVTTTTTTALPPTTTTTTTAAPAPTTVPITAAPAPAPSRSERCAGARSAVAAAGLKLPAGFGYTCAAATELYPGDREHWGTMCSHHAPECATSGYIAVNIDLIGPDDARLRYVVAHETCHALDAAANRPTSEDGADACAAAHGFPRV